MSKSSPSSKSPPARFCIDTTVVYYLLHGPRRQQEAARAYRDKGDLVVTGVRSWRVHSWVHRGVDRPLLHNSSRVRCEKRDSSLQCRAETAPTHPECLYQRQRLQEMGADLCSDAWQAKNAQHKGYHTQAKYLQMADTTKKAAPTCWYCERLGDSVIALSVPADQALLTGDSQSFPAFAEILGIRVQTIAPKSRCAMRNGPGSRQRVEVERQMVPISRQRKRPDHHPLPH